MFSVVFISFSRNMFKLLGGGGVGCWVFISL